MTNTSPTKLLSAWYTSQCDGQWEHEYGVIIDTLDNPGWRLKIDLTDTELIDNEFIPLEREASEDDWVHCSVKDASFVGYGGPQNLDELITVFLNWADTASRNSQQK